MFIVFKVPISEIYLLINSNTMRFLGIVFLFWIVILASCKKEVGNVIVEGRVINVGTQQPIEGVTVVIENEVSFTPSHLDSTFTNANGEFRIELPNEEDAWIYLRKDGWTFHSSSLNNVTGYLTYYPVGMTSNVKLEMYPDARFNGKFMNTNPSLDDSLYFNELTYFGSINYGGGGFFVRD
ncbi:MAG: energy-coupling factor transporter transmembrane protein EcfT [Salibacteraceae bacterium]|jgi:energy-coupling factor transporter transmembrane protein EcfT